jgi:cytochrome c oxidase subunit III
MSETRMQQGMTGKIGMWLFISTEVILFGGLFLLYSMYRLKNPVDFHNASQELSLFAGTLNTCILITSSLTAALSIFFLEHNKPKRSQLFLLFTILFAAAFLVVKAFEWSAKFKHGLYPDAAELLSKPKGENLYFGLYFMMTGLHAFHVIVGMFVLSVLAVWIRQEKLTSAKPILLENTVLYWHLVDMIWIFLFPLFYLIS